MVADKFEFDRMFSPHEEYAVCYGKKDIYKIQFGATTSKYRVA